MQPPDLEREGELTTRVFHQGVQLDVSWIVIVVLLDLDRTAHATYPVNLAEPAGPVKLSVSTTGQEPIV